MGCIHVGETDSWLNSSELSSVFPHDDYVAQGNQTSRWLERIADRAEDFGFPLDKLPLLLTQDFLGPRTMGNLLNEAHNASGMAWSASQEVFLRCFPSTPPLVTHNTWKQLSMNKQGSYHAFVTVFSRELALIEAGPAEVIEQILHGLSALLTSSLHVFITSSRNSSPRHARCLQNSIWVRS